MTSAALTEVDELLAVVEEMELDRRLVDLSRAEQAELLARAAGRPALAARARLIAADALCRRGEMVAAAPIMYEVNHWAADQDERYVLARSHFQLSILQTWLGDNADARHHALLSVDWLPDDAPPNIRGNHLIMLALSVGSVSRADAAKYHAEALDIAAATGDSEMSRSTLNNMAYAAYQDGDAEAATELVERMYRVVRSTDAEMRPADLDTVARVKMLAGLYAEAEAILLPLVDAETVGLLDAEGNMLGEMLLTIAEAQRLRGAHDRVQATLDRCVACCEERGLAEIRARARREQARLFADQGRYREAYEEQVRYDEESVLLRSAERERQAHLAQLVFESREGRRDAERFRELALRDPLTGLYNRRFVDSQLPVLLDRAIATSRPLSAALIDVDFFKRINDTLSHEVGDQVLRTLAEVLTASADLATVARFGGEEFVLVMPDLDTTEAAGLAERVRHAVQQHPWTGVTGQVPVTVSIGVATFGAGDMLPAVLMGRADERLYAAKRAGRNRVVGETRPG